MNIKKLSISNRILRCLVNAFRFHIKLEEIIYNSATEDNLLFNENVKEINNELDVLTLKLYNQHRKLKY